MPAELVYLDSEDLKLIQLLLDEYKRRNPTRIGPTASDDTDDSTPETYLVRLPDEGIPALTIGEEGYEDYAGSAECDVVKLVINYDDEDHMEVLDAGFSITVYNTTQTPVKGLYKTVWRDKYGDWVTEPVPDRVRIAKTAEAYDEDEETYSYPAFDERYLPIVFQTVTIDQYGALTYEDDTANPEDYAYSPMAWYPPGCIVEVVFDGDEYRIIRGPTSLFGVATGYDISAAEWNEDGDEYTLGTGTVSVWTLQGSVYKVLKYQDDSEVEMTFKNISDVAVAQDKLLLATLHADGQWIVTVEPCGGTRP